MEKELEYLKMYLDWSSSSDCVNSELTIYNQSISDYTLSKENNKPIIETYDIISIRENNVIVSHMEDRISNKTDTIEVSFETFSLEEFKKSKYFNSVINSFSLSYENALEKGKELYEKYQDSLQPSTHHSTYKLTKTFETSNGEYVEMNVDFMENAIEIDSTHFSTHGEVDFDSITIVDKEEYERLKESSRVLDVLIQSLDKGASIQKIKNGYIIDDMYYESLEEFLEINEK